MNAATAAWLERRRIALLVAVTLLALVVRLWGVRWGAPSRIDLHPDEIDYILANAQKVSLHHLDPGFLNYPAFMMYLIHFTAVALRRLGWLSEVWQMHVVGRTWSALFGAATVPAVYLLARELGARAPGALLAALWTMLLPYHVNESHVAVTDTLMTFWVVLTLVGAVRLLQRDRARDWAFTGAALGLATGSKYTAALAVAAILIAALLNGQPFSRKARGLAVAGAAALVACFVVTPYTFIRFPDFLAAMAYESRHTAGHHFGFSLPAAGPQYHRYLYQILAAWPFSFGIGLYFSVVAGTLWTALSLDRRRVVVLGFALLFFGVTGSWNLTPLRYYLPLLVLGALFAGLWQEAWLEAQAPAKRAIAAAAILVAFVYTGVFTWQTTRRYSHETRVEASLWLEKYKPDAAILLFGWSRYLAQPQPGSRIRVDQGSEGDLDDPAKIAAYDLVQVTSLVYGRYTRHGNVEEIARYARLGKPESGLRLVKRFEADYLNKRFYMMLDPMFEGYFISPTLEFYAPTNRAGS